MMKDESRAHLSDEELTGLREGKAPAAASAHLADCPGCRAEVEEFRAAIEGFGESVRASAKRPEGFWAWQRQVIARRLEKPAPFPWRLAWAGAMALLILAAALLMREEPRGARVAQTDPDHALLVEVERTVRRPVPIPLEPAVLLAQELNRAALESERSTKPRMPTDQNR